MIVEWKTNQNAPNVKINPGKKEKDVAKLNINVRVANIGFRLIVAKKRYLQKVC